MKSSIGIFDSGVGGLTVVNEFIKVLPFENILYFGDTARVPYGAKSKEEMILIVREIIDWMLEYNVKAVAMACNTSSALALDIIKSEYNIPIFGLIQPTAKHIAGLSGNISKVGVIATEATVKSHAYRKLIKEYSSSIEIIEIACPGLVEIIESGQITTTQAYYAVKKFIDPLLSAKVDKIILGCTHYPFLKNLITQITEDPGLLVNPAEFLVQEMNLKLQEQGLKISFNPNVQRNFFVSAYPQNFIQIGSALLPSVIKTENVSLIRTFDTKPKQVAAV